MTRNKVMWMLLLTSEGIFFSSLLIKLYAAMHPQNERMRNTVEMSRKLMSRMDRMHPIADPSRLKNRFLSTSSIKKVMMMPMDLPPKKNGIKRKIPEIIR